MEVPAPVHALHYPPSWLGLSRWAGARVRSSVFWGVQASVIAITALHYYLEASRVLPAFEHTMVILYVVPILIASLRFSREGGFATSLWAVALTVPNILIWHRHDFLWLEDAIPALLIGSVGIVLATRVESEIRQSAVAEQASRELQRLASRYRCLFESAGDAVLVFDRDGSILLANPAAASELGYSVEALEASTLAEVLGDEPGGRLTEALARVEGESPGEASRARTQIALADNWGTKKTFDVALAIVEDESHHLAGQAVLRDITVQREREESLKLYAAQITLAQERERQRIARELHDDAVQSLVSLCQGLDQLNGAGAKARQAPDPGELRELAKHTLDSVRRFARDLRPTLLDDLGLMAAIHWLVADAGKRLRIDARMEVAGKPRRLQSDAEVTLFRVVQEALHNVERHAAASQVLVELEFANDAVHIRVTDDGKGFAVPPALRSLAGSGHLGLLGMQERVQLLGGTLQLRSHPGEGTCIEVSVSQVALPEPREAKPVA
jgi:two-component system sensor histidine kinase UhpB